FTGSEDGPATAWNARTANEVHVEVNRPYRELNLTTNSHNQLESAAWTGPLSAPAPAQVRQEIFPLLAGTRGRERDWANGLSRSPHDLSRTFAGDAGHAGGFPEMLRVRIHADLSLWRVKLLTAQRATDGGHVLPAGRLNRLGPEMDPKIRG